MDNKIKIIFVIDSVDFGGTQILTFDILNLIAQRNKNISISILSIFPSGNEKNIIKYSDPKINVEFIDIFKLGILKRIRILKNKLREYDIVHSSLEFSNFYTSMINFFWPFKKYVVSFHGLEGMFFLKELNYPRYKEIFGFKYRLYIYYLQNIFYKRAKYFFAVSEKTKQQISRYRGIKKEFITKFHFGIKIEKYSKIEKDQFVILKSKLNLKPTDFVLGYIGRLSYGKGLLEFIKYFSEDFRQNESFKFIIVGGGELEKDIISLIREEKIQNSVLIEGFKTDISEYYSIFDTVILPSYSEGLPISILEAMLFKKIVIASNVGGIPEVISDKYNGYIFDINNFAELRKIIYFVKENFKGLGQIEENAYQTILKNYSLSNNINNFIQLLLKN